MKKLVLLLSVLFLSVFIYAGIVPEKEAEKVAKTYFYQAINGLDNDENTAWDNIILNCIVNPERDKNALYYVFNVNKDNGYILISSHYSITPVLAYSLVAGFNIGNIAPGQQLFLDYYSESIEYAFENDIDPSKKASEKWGYYLNYKPEQKFKQKTTVGPLLGPIEWNQTWPYNAMCPEDPNAHGGRVPVGCVATSILQMMKYYNWPEVGEGSVFHSSYMNGGYGNYNINYAQQNYDWYSIPAKASPNYNEELAKINLHGGVAVRMYWTAGGSASTIERALTALKDNFKYSPDISFIEKSNYTGANWANILKSQIDNNKPMVYSGVSSNVGHAWNCDGYQGDEHFHMNWGWGGNGNGFYTLDDLNSTATPGGDENNFIYHQQALINIYPRDNYPEFCGGIKNITGTEGSFDDGSSSSNYQPNTNCTYVISPECGAIVNLNFYKFDLADGAVVEIYNGDQNSDILLASFDNNNEPVGVVTSDLGAMTIKFISDDQEPTASGWGATYSVNYCKTNIMLTAPSGSFDDGSGICEYEKSSVCTWIIEPEEANYITIEFKEFDLAGGADFVKIFKNSMSSANTIETFTAANPPDETVYVDAGVAVIQFFADAGNVAQGWKINYNSGEATVKESNFVSNLSIIPNPGNNDSEIYLYLDKKSNISFYVYNVLGKKIDENTISLNAGNNNIRINEIVNKKLKTGMYFINIETNNKIYTEKFVVVD